MENRGLLALAFIILFAAFIISNITGDVISFDSNTGMNFNPVSGGRYATGNTNHDPEGMIDTWDLERIKNLISIRHYDLAADMDQDKDVDWDDYYLLADFIESGKGNGEIFPRAGLCSLGETKCAPNTQSGTGTIFVCRMNEYGVPEMFRENCNSGDRCRNGVCERKVASVESLQRLSHKTFFGDGLWSIYHYWLQCF